MSEQRSITHLENMEIVSYQKETDERDDFIEFLHSPPEIDISSEAQSVLKNELNRLDNDKCIRTRYDTNTEGITLEIDYKNPKDMTVNTKEIDFIFDPISFETLSSIDITLGSSDDTFKIEYSIRKYLQERVSCTTDENGCSGINCC